MTQEVPTTPRPPDGIAWVINGTDTVRAEVARTAEERAQGLMGRDSVPDGTGMLFVWTDSSVRNFWMRDTPINLDIAFIDTEFRVVDVQQMEAMTENFHTSAAPAMFALEVRFGWFAERQWEVGDQLEVVFPLR